MTDYFRFEQSKVLNLITTSSGNVVYDKTEKLAVSPALENVNVWNVRTGTLVRIHRFGPHSHICSTVSGLILTTKPRSPASPAALASLPSLPLATLTAPFASGRWRALIPRSPSTATSLPSPRLPGTRLAPASPLAPVTAILLSGMCFLKVVFIVSVATLMVSRKCALWGLSWCPCPRTPLSRPGTCPPSTASRLSLPTAPRSLPCSMTRI